MPGWRLNETRYLKAKKSVGWAGSPVTFTKVPPKQREARELPDEIRGVYFLRQEQRFCEEEEKKEKTLIKIGHGDVKKRLENILRTIGPNFFLAVEGIIEDRNHKGLEEKLHEKFEHLRVAWEWFEPADELYEYIHKNSNKELAQDLSWHLWNLANKEVNRWE